MDDHTLRLLNETDFCGYVIEDYNGYFGNTTCPNGAAAMCLDRERVGGEELSQWIKCYRLATLGEYSDTPGKRIVENFDYAAAINQLMN